MKAHNTFTVISGDYGQFPAPDASLTFVSIDVQLEAEYSPIFKSQIMSKKRCADEPCLNDGICHDIKPDGECWFYQSTFSPQHKNRSEDFCHFARHPHLWGSLMKLSYCKSTYALTAKMGNFILVTWQVPVLVKRLHHTRMIATQ